MRTAFTGTRHGMTTAQLDAVRDVLQRRQGWLHHGDCLGSDKQAHDIGRALGFRITGHPPLNPVLRAYCECDELREPKPYIARDHDIVDETDELVAAPAEMQEILRSGTWATVRRARKMRKVVTIVYPDGTLEFCP